MIPTRPHQWFTGDTLTPTKLNENFERLADFAEQSLALKYAETDIVLDYSGWTETSNTNERDFRIKIPFAYEIVGVEVVLYAATGISVQLAVRDAGVAPSNWTDTDALASAGATTRARAVSNRRTSIAANTEIRYTLLVTGTPYTLTKAYVVVKIRHDRATGSTYGIASAPRFAAGETVAAAKVNTAFTALETAVAADTAATNNLRVIVTRFKNEAAIATSDRDLRIPATGRRLHSYDVLTHGGVGVDFTVTFLDETGATVSTTTVAGSGSPPAKTQGVSVNQTQANSDPTVVAKDWKQRCSNAGGTTPVAYVISYWT